MILSFTLVNYNFFCAVVQVNTLISREMARCVQRLWNSVIFFQSCGLTIWLVFDI